MSLKVIIVILFFLLVISLFTSFKFLMAEESIKQQKHAMLALSIRSFLAVLLLSIITYRFFSGKIKSKAPWIQQPAPTLQSDHPQKSGD